MQMRKDTMVFSYGWNLNLKRNAAIVMYEYYGQLSAVATPECNDRNMYLLIIHIIVIIITIKFVPTDILHQSHIVFYTFYWYLNFLYYKAPTPSPVYGLPFLYMCWSKLTRNGAKNIHKYYALTAIGIHS